MCLGSKIIKVNEKGTEAASITYTPINITGISFPKYEVEFIADRPFLFLIRDLKSNAILFTGMVSKPSKFVKSSELWARLKYTFKSLTKRRKK